MPSVFAHDAERCWPSACALQRHLGHVNSHVFNNRNLPVRTFCNTTFRCRVKRYIVRPSVVPVLSRLNPIDTLVLYFSNIMIIVIILCDKSRLQDKIILPTASGFGLPGFHYRASCLSVPRLKVTVISLITVTIFGDSCKLWSFALRNFSALLFGQISYV
jgi:hypothetical protein